MARCRLYSDSIIRPILRRELSEEDYKRVSEKLHNCPMVDAIPEGYIKHYAERHDAVCQVNLQNLVQNFHSDSGGKYGDSGTE